MKKIMATINSTNLRLVVSSIGILGVLLLLGCNVGVSYKIPITTSSEAAREYFIMGRDLNERLRFDEAREYFEKAIREDSTFAIAWLGLAFVSNRQSSFLETLEIAVANIDGISEGERLMILATEAGVANADLPKSEELLRKLVKLYPRDERAHTLLANLFFGLQRLTEAVAEYKIAIKIFPYYSPPHNQLGYVYRNLGKYEMAEKAFEEYSRIIPDEPNPHDSYAEFLCKRGKYKQSIETYRKALQIDSGFIPSYLGIASNYVFLGDYTRARQELHTALSREINPGQRRQVLFGLLITFVDQSETERAIDIQTDRIAIAAADADTVAIARDLALMGAIFLEAGRFDDARTSYNRAVDLVNRAGLSDAIIENMSRARRYSFARLAVIEGDLSEARRLALENREHAEEAGNPILIRQGHELAGIIAFAEEEFDVALEEFSQANQQNPYIFYRMGLVYEGMGDRVDARLMFEQAAYFNAVNSLQLAFIRNRALKKLQHI